MRSTQMQIPMLDLKAQYETIRQEVSAAIADVCEKQAFALGPAVAAFEEHIAEYCGCKHAVGVSSGTDALLVSLMALGIGPGDEVITTPFTFFATAGSVARLGARPVFADVDGQSFNIDPAQVRQKVTGRTRAIVPVHLFGQMAPMKAICEVAAEHGLAVVEDAAQAIGASQGHVKAGCLGDYGCFSFYPSKNLSAFGDAGLVTTNSDQNAERIRMLRNHGQGPAYFYKVVGGNFRLDGIQAAVLDVKLRYIERWNERRRRIAGLYDELLAEAPVGTPRIEPGNTSIYHQYTITAPRRDALRKHLAEKGIASAIFYPRPLHLQECFAQLGYAPGDFPVAEKLCAEVLSLPIYPELTSEQVEYVAETICRFYD